MSEYSYDQIMTALRNADAAGDTEAATRLASIAKGLKQAPVEQRIQKEEDGLITRMAKGATGALGAATDFLAPVGMAVGGLSALGKLATGGSLDEAVKETQNYNDLQPTQLLQRAGVDKSWLENPGQEAINYPIEKFGELTHGIGSTVTDVTGSPLAGTIANVGTGMAALGLGAKALTGAPKPLSENAVKIAELRAKKAAEEAPKEMPTTQAELDLGQPNQFGNRPSDFTVDEHGIPFLRDKSLEAQETVRQGDLFSLENQAQELRNDVLNKAEPQFDEGYPTNREYLKQQEEELAYQQKAKQDTLPIEDTINEPSQRSIEIEKPQERTTYRPGGQRAFGKSQRGSIGFFGKDPFEKFADNIRKDVPDATPEEIKQLWDEQTAKSQALLKPQEVSAAQNKAAKDITGYSPKYTGEVLPPEQAIEAFKTIPDIAPENRSFVKEQLASSGRLQRNLFNNPVTDWVYNLTNKAVEKADLRARKILDDVGTGVIPQIRKNVMFKKTGEAEMRQYLKWRYENEGKASVLPENFSPEVRKIHETLNNGDKELLDRINEVLVKDGLNPIIGLDNHMVHYWSGPYRAYIYIKTAGGGSRLAFFVSEKSHADATKALNWIKENIPNIDLEKTSDISFVKADARSRSQMFDLLLKLSNEKDPLVAETLQAFYDRTQQAESRHLGEQHRQDRRAGVQGFLGNKPWLSEARNYSDAMESIRNKYDAGYQWVAAQEIRQQMEPILKAQQEGKISVGTAISLGQKYIDHALGRNIDTSAFTKMADYLEEMSPRKFGFARKAFNETMHVFNRITLPYLLALKGTQAVQSVLQVGQATLPKMLEMQKVYGGDLHHVATAFAEGSMDGLFHLTNTATGGVFESVAQRVLNLGGKDFSETSKAIRQAVKDLDIARMSLSDTGSAKEGGFAKSWGNSLAEGFLEAPMNLFEGPTRTWAFSSFVRQAVKDGHSMKDAITLAKEQMDTMVNYNPEASAMGLSNLGMVGKEAKGLHTFMINYYTQLANYVKLAKDAKDPAPLLAYLGITFALGGAVGFIGTDLADWLIDEVKTAMRGTNYDSPDFQKFSLRKFLLENAPESISVGPLSTGTSLGLYGSFTTKVVDPDRTLLDNLFPKTMASMQIAKGVFGAHKLLDPNITNKERGTVYENLAPKFLTQTIRNRYQNKDGTVYDPNADRAGFPMYKRTDQERAISKHGFGIRGLSEVLAQEDMSNLFKGQKNVTESQKKQLMNLDQTLVDVMKSGKEPNTFQQAKIQKQMSNLVSVWHVDETQLQNHIEQLAQNYGIPGEALRRLVQIKGAKLSDVDKIKDLTSIYNRQQERQMKYGR